MNAVRATLGPVPDRSSQASLSSVAVANPNSDTRVRETQAGAPPGSYRPATRSTIAATPSGWPHGETVQTKTSWWLCDLCLGAAFGTVFPGIHSGSPNEKLFL